MGYSENTISLLAMVLAIGILVEDAIVVVENVERVMEEEPDLSPADLRLGDLKLPRSSLQRHDRASRCQFAGKCPFGRA